MPKLQTLRRDPVVAMRSAVNRYIYGPAIRPLLYRLSAAQLRRTGCTTSLEARNSGAIPPDYVDLGYLYRTVRSLQPKLVLEFGSGCSTTVIAQALKDNHADHGVAGKLYSLESDEFWAGVTRDAIPETLTPYVELSVNPVVEATFSATPGFRYANVPQLPFDMIYIDGPMHTAERRVAFDVLDLEPLLPADYLGILDGRMTNARFLQQHLKRNYEFRHSRLYDHTTFRPR